MTIQHDAANDEAAIRQLLDRFAQAFRDKDADAIMSCFAATIVSYDIVPPLQTVGAEAFAPHWRALFESHQGPIHVEFPEIHIAVAGDAAFSYCLHRIRGTLKNGQPTDRWMRWTACYRKIDGRWLIVHEHVSVPIDPGNAKALTDLEP